MNFLLTNLYPKSMRLSTLIFLLLLIYIRLPSQTILIDRPIEAGGLICFPTMEDQTVYRYLPSDARLTQRADDLVEFSMMIYQLDRQDSGIAEGSIDQNKEGGGILAFSVEYHTPQKKD